MDYAQTKEGATYLSDRIQKYYDTYKRVESDKTYEGSADEFVFDYLAGVFSTEEGVKDFSNYMTEENISQKEQKSILETVADFFKELYDKIVSFLDDHVLSETAKKGLEADAEKAQEIRDMVLGVWSEAEKNQKSNKNIKNVTDEKYSFGGIGALNADRNGLSKAIELESRNESEEKILKETGWFRGADHKWRFEIDDSKATVFRNGDAKLSSDPEYQKFKQLSMNGDFFDADYERLSEKYAGKMKKGIMVGDYLDHQDLFDNYPALERIFLKHKKFVNGTNGSYEPDINTIFLNEDLFDAYKENQLKKTLLHELQHIIQHSERFARGGSLRTWKDVEIRKNQKRFQEAENTYKNVFKNGSDEFKNLIRTLNRLSLNGDFGEEYTRIENELYDKYEDMYNAYDSALFEARLYSGSEYLSDREKYLMTAGEIEARDVSNRAELTADERKNKMPVRETENGVIFAENKQNPFEYMEESANKYSLPIDEQREYEKSENKELYDFAMNSKNGLNPKKAYFKLSNSISERLADDIKKCLGINVKGFSNEISDNGIKHIEKRHGSNGIADHSMENLHDIARIAYAINEYEKIREGNYSGEYHCKTVVLQKKLGEKYYYVVEAAPDTKHKTLHVVSAFINENDTFPGVAVSNDPSQYVQDEPQSNVSSSKDIISQTEKKETKKYSIDIDDSFFDSLYGEPSEHETEMSSIIQEGFESLKNVEVNERMMHKIAYAIKKENKSTYDIDKLTSNLTKVFAYLKEHQNADYNDMIRIVQEVAKPVIEESTDVDPYEQQAYKDVRDYVKGLDIRLNDEQKAEVAYYYGSYEKFRKMNFGNFNFTDKGTYLDNLWTEILIRCWIMMYRQQTSRWHWSIC